MTRKRIILSSAVVLTLFIILGLVFYVDQSRNRVDQSIVPTKSPVMPQNVKAPVTEVVAENLSVPWDLAFLPDGDILITERNGTIKRLFLSSDQHVQRVAVIDEVLQQGEGGLHGITLHPDFSDNSYVYIYYTYAANGVNTNNRVVRYQYNNNSLTNPTIVIDEIPGAFFHDGGRIRFGPDNFLYVTTGDAQEPSLSQNRNSLAGKILRVTENGDPAPGNPFGTRIFSYGHRNPQGITWDDSGNLWETEHGPSGTGASCCRDEINFIKPGSNYGWPAITGDQTQRGMISPVLESGPNTIWAPAGIVFLNGSLYFAGLRGEALYQAKVESENLSQFTVHFENQFGRIRAVTVGPDNLLYISTSNRDGRGNPRTGDDKIIRINPEKL